MKNKIVFNWMLDLRKEEIDPKERADIINKFLYKNNISQRELARKLGIPPSTIQDWCLFGKLSEEEIDNLKDRGMTNTQIYRMLRNNKKIDREKLIEKTALEYELEESIKKLKNYIKKPIGDKVEQLIRELKDILNHMEMYVKKREGR